MANRVKGNDFEKGRRGICDLVRLSPTRARLDFYPTEKEKQVSFQIEVSFGEEGTLPDYVPFKKMQDKSKIQMSATMDKEGKRVLYANPSNGYFEAKFKNFVAESGKAPCPQTKPGKKAGTSYRDFAAMIEISGGDWNGTKIKEGVWLGATYYHRMYDNFADNGDGFLAVKGSGSGSDSLVDFLDATVNGGEDIEFSENPLPEIEKRALELGNVFNINVSKGWIASIVQSMTLQDDDEIDFLEGEVVSENKNSEEEIPAALREDN